jgi:L-alanine-DL-glutamate epimerase-like enolase superfamily enzyme
MSSRDEMIAQAEEKIASGFSCIKMKIGAIEKKDELEVIRHIKSAHPSVIIRVDANGGLSRWKDVNKTKADISFALSFMEELANLNVHSIEQPIWANEDDYAELCASTALPIALDEQLIPCVTMEEKRQILEHIKPAHIILKPTLLGGLRQCTEWISLAESTGIGWWVTSALESNVGLNVIAQWLATQDFIVHQGLGTGGLFHNNINSPLEVKGGQLSFNPIQSFQFNGILDP